MPPKMPPTGSGSTRGLQRGCQTRGYTTRAKPLTKRAREKNSEYEDIEDYDPLLMP